MIFDPPTAKGITFTASLPFITEPGRVRDRVEEAWQSLKAGLIRGRLRRTGPIAVVIEGLRSGGRRFRQTVVAELSLVTIPANIGSHDSDGQIGRPLAPLRKVVP